jgi:hypothetical protein
MPCLPGDDAPRLKPDPIIYTTAAERMGVLPSECLVVEDSVVGLKAATGAGMRCIITYTRSTRDQVRTLGQDALAWMAACVASQSCRCSNAGCGGTEGARHALGCLVTLWLVSVAWEGGQKHMQSCGWPSAG